MPDDVVFWVLAVPAVASGAMVFRYDSMARATYALLLSLLCVGGLVIRLGLDYLGVVVILMMTIEMALMAVFMVMFMMNPAGLLPMSMVHNKRGAAAVSAAVFVLLAAGIVLAPWPGRRGKPDADPTMALGESLMGPHMLTMMTLGLALFTTIVATVVLATGRGRYDRFGDDLCARRPADPVRPGARR
ncbi:NADH-quinone oxidoreductase subunit J [Streptomyces sp. CMB-StM0423]|uniref:NADH-quinone oxidoreductase subunit J n=1 Tax=Streptomyces sp. CMB-StM0423 TaxID=2059884 RepID=UPI000C700E9B|nr:NADH-quinone oxidoreductase subunit J [Streptomyces sp. CMB-StM0423]AUH39534.1 NADH:ubiquinone oxidoreductase subunit J [Streptomyces sp. CMB-StM0423]